MPPTAVGQYHVVATTTDANYGAVSASGSLVIEAASASIALDAATLTAAYDGTRMRSRQRRRRRALATA